MRPIALLVVLCFVAPAVAHGEEGRQKVAAATATNDALESYVVQLTEFRLKASSDPKLTADAIAQAFLNSKKDETVEPIETVRLSTLEGAKSMAQFGRRVNATVGTVSSGRGTTARQTQFFEIGTLVEVTATPRAGKVLLELSYESSRFDGKVSDDAPPNFITTTIQSSHLLEIDKPILVGGTSAGDTSFLLLSVSH